MSPSSAACTACSLCRYSPWLRLEDGSLWPWMLGEIPLTVSVMEEEPAMTQPQDEQQAGNGLNSGLIILAAVALGAVRLVVKQLNEKDHF